jgi:hypothetical protein
MSDKDLRGSMLTRLGRAFTWARPGRLAAAALGFPIFFVLTTALLTVLGSQRFQAQADQPVEFNHRLHVEDVGLECTECHPYFEDETFSGLPGADACSFCHDEVQGSDPEEAKLYRLLSDEQPLEWRPLFRQPSHVFYSHRRHVKVAKLECEICHGSIAASEAPPQRVDTLDMDGCIGCHEQQGVGNDCTSCHR